MKTYLMLMSGQRRKVQVVSSSSRANPRPHANRLYRILSMYNSLAWRTLGQAVLKEVVAVAAVVLEEVIEAVELALKPVEVVPKPAEVALKPVGLVKPAEVVVGAMIRPIPHRPR